MIKKIGKRIFNLAKLAAHRMEDVPVGHHMFHNHIEALYAGHVHSDFFFCPAKREVVFRCPVDLVVSSNAFNHSSSGWHPFSATLQAYERGNEIRYTESVLNRFCSVFRPKSVFDAIAGWNGALDSFKGLPSYAILPSWNPSTLGDVVETVKSWVAQDNAEHDAPDLDIDDGCNYYGPVSDEKGRLEYRRLCNVYRSMAERGYDRSMAGSVKVNALRRDTEYPFIAASGHHRIAAAKAAGLTHIPAKFRFTFVLDVREASYWPQIQRGTWTEKTAVSYFNHLFDLDAYEWAIKRNLVPNS